MRIYVDQVFESMKREDTVVLNILSATEFRKLHIKGSQSHPLKDDQVAFGKEVEEKYGKDKNFILYGDHFGLLDSFMATHSLQERGLKALNFADGVQEWARRGLDVEGSQVHPEPAVES
jgi:rhodanese-related sulfurtransferase